VSSNKFVKRRPNRKPSVWLKASIYPAAEAWSTGNASSVENSMHIDGNEK